MIERPIEDLINDPEIRRITTDISSETVERQRHIPPRCDAFLSPYTITQNQEKYRFTVHPEARNQLPDIITNKVVSVIGVESLEDEQKSHYCKQRNIGIVFSGGPAPGGHNVIAGLFDAAKAANPANRVFGFLLGPDGIIENEAVEITEQIVNKYRNTGGFGMIKTGRAKIDTKEKMNLSKKTCHELGLDALVIVGGDDSNTNAAFLAQELKKDRVQVIGVPKTIDGDIQVRDDNGNLLCAMSFGFHTAARAFAESVSNLCTDSSSDVKYWHICKVMGRVASHLALEVALQTHANITLIGEDLANYVNKEQVEKEKKDGLLDYTGYGMTLHHLSRMIAEFIAKRAAAGKNYGVIVIPEGVLEFINEVQVIIIKLNTIIAKYNQSHDTNFHTDFPTLKEKLEYLQQIAKENKKFSIWNIRDDKLFNEFPAFFQEGLLIERDAHGNFQFSQVETDKVLTGLVKNHLKTMKAKGDYRIGISRDWYKKTMENEGLDPQRLGLILFENYNGNSPLLIKKSISSAKALNQELVKAGILKEGDKTPKVLEKVYKRSVPSFKTQQHFFGYDGRGSDPTWFDCTYTYNLGLTVFSLIANSATGQMAAIRNLELEFSKWEPIGIPIAPLMNLEERQGKLSLVLEKSVVDVESAAFRLIKALRDEWLAASPHDDKYRRPEPLVFGGDTVPDKPLVLKLEARMKNL